jgi:hypothetical protein
MLRYVAVAALMIAALFVRATGSTHSRGTGWAARF